MLNHEIQKEIVFDPLHVEAYAIISRKPGIDDLCRARVELVGEKYRVFIRTGILLAKVICFGVMILEVEYVHCLGTPSNKSRV